MIILSRPFIVLSLFFLFASSVFAIEKIDTAVFPVEKIDTAVFPVEKIDINTASLEQLDKIIGIGPVLAQRIVDARPFSSVDDLIKVKGIGEKTLQKIKDQEWAYIGAQLSVDDPIAENSQIEARPLLLTYPSGVVINEILSSPEGPDAEEEWIEIYNQNSFPVLLSGWKLEDSVGQINTFTFPENYQIAANGFLTLNRQITKIVINNDEDGLKLIQPNGVIADQMSFNNALRGQSYSRTKENNWLWTSVLTPGAENISSAKISSAEQGSVIPANTELNQESPPESVNLDKQELAAIGEQEITARSYYLFLFALPIAFLAGILIFVVRKKYVRS